MEEISMQHCGTKSLETERLLLRQFKRKDATAMYENWASDPRVTKFLTWPTHKNIQETREIISQWIKSYMDKSTYHWCIALKKENMAIGSISVVHMKESLDLVHIGYCIGYNYWNRGYTSEALLAIIDFLINEVKVNRIESVHDSRNIASGRVMEKCGMQYEGVLREAELSNIGIGDRVYYGLLASDIEK